MRNDADGFDGGDLASTKSLASLINLRNEGMIGFHVRVARVPEDPDATVNYQMKGSDQGVGSPPNQPVHVADDFGAIAAAISTDR